MGMLLLSSILVLIALIILVVKDNFIFVLFALELILLAVNMNFILASLQLDDFLGQSISLLLFSLAATDTSVGLVLLLNFYQQRSSKGTIRKLTHLKS